MFGEQIREDYASDLGCDPSSLYNSHRVFRYNSRNMAVLKDLVKRQSLREYLELINENNIDERIARMKREKLLSFWDGDFDDMEPFDEPAPDMARDLDGDWVPADDLWLIQPVCVNDADGLAFLFNTLLHQASRRFGEFLR